MSETCFILRFFPFLVSLLGTLSTLLLLLDIQPMSFVLQSSIEVMLDTKPLVVLLRPFVVRQCAAFARAYESKPTLPVVRRCVHTSHELVGLLLLFDDGTEMLLLGLTGVVTDDIDRQPVRRAMVMNFETVTTVDVAYVRIERRCGVRGDIRDG